MKSGVNRLPCEVELEHRMVILFQQRLHPGIHSFPLRFLRFLMFLLHRSG